MSGGVRQALELALVFVAYTATARLGLSFGALGGIATTVWPPTGVALAALVLRGPRLWPAVAGAALAVNLTTGIPIWSALIIAVGNTLEGLTGAALLRRFGFDARVARLRDVLLLVFPAALGSTVISATFGLVAVMVSEVKPADSYAVFWAVWWIGDAMGDMLIAPLVCVWAAGSRRLSGRPLRWIEAALLAASLTLVSLVVFRRLLPVRAVELVRGTYAIVPIFIWAALRFEQRGVTSALILVAVVAVTSTWSPGGYFSAPAPHERLLMVQCYMAVTAVSMLILAAAISERRAAIGVRDEFISIASHELKTPLTALKLRLTALTRLGSAPGSEMEGRWDKSLTAANTTADRIVSLVDDLLDASRLTAGRLALHLETVVFAELVRDVVGRLREHAAESGSTIQAEVDESIVGTWDRIRIEQVVTNLLSNAIKYGLGKPITVTASLVGERVRLQVADRGMGISKADHARIFQAFERVVTSSRVGGLGLGLYIGRQIATAHGGTLSVESQPSPGTTFTLELPLESISISSSGVIPSAGGRAS